MQIALTKKLAKAMEINPPALCEEIDPIFSWTANWTKVWADSKTEDMLVLVNNATRFTVAIYEINKKSLKNVDEMMKNAIVNTLLAFNFNREAVDEYMRLAGEINFVKNSSRQTSSWVSKSGEYCSYLVADKYNGIDIMYSDTVGAPFNRMIVNCSKSESEAFYPYKAMSEALSKVTKMEVYKYKAFRLEISLDLLVYKAVRKVIVPANIKFKDLHKVIQNIYKWENYHLYDFTIFKKKKKKDIKRIVPYEESLDYDKNAILMEDHTLEEFMTKEDSMVYTYDMGDDWDHNIKIKKVIEEYSGESPYLEEAVGQGPPEDAGGVYAFNDFYKIMQNPESEEYEEKMEWVGFWNLELSSYEKGPRVIDL